MLKLAILATRGLQIIFSAAVLGLSITLAKGQLLGHVPTTTEYSAFLGGLGMIAGAFGILTVFVHIFDGIIALAVDGVVAMLFIAGGAAMAIMLKGGKCNDVEFIARNKIVNCGAVFSTIDGQQWVDGLCGVDGKSSLDSQAAKVTKILQTRCDEATADFGLMFAVVATTFLALALNYMWKRKGSGGYVI